MSFTTRPEIQGTFGVVTSTHWIASAVGMKMLEAGGNAFDAAVAMGFVLHVVEPHLNGPLGDLPILMVRADEDEPRVICGQGPAPAGASIAHYRSEGLARIPGSGLLATVIPGAFDAWMLMLRDHGSMPLRSVLEPAIHYAEHGHPLLASVSDAIANMAEFFTQEWPTSAEVWLDQGNVPKAGHLFCNPHLAQSWKRLLREAESKSSREQQIEAARDAFYQGFVAEKIDTYLRDAAVMDAEGGRRKGVLCGQDMAGWRARYEDPVSVEYHGWRVWKTGPWGQGVCLLQSLLQLQQSGIGGRDHRGADFIHQVAETLKLSMADREAYYGDPDFDEIPLDVLLSQDYARQRQALVGDQASLDQRPGRIPGFEHLADAAIERAVRYTDDGMGAGAGEPTMAHLQRTNSNVQPAVHEGDTVHLDVIDRFGNMVSATPSGGWLQSSPIIPGLGMPLNSRAQMFWLDEGMPTSLAPGKRPRTTLSPSIAGRDGRPSLAFGTPGGDQQDQWQLILLLRLIHHDLNLQEGIDAPLFHTGHCQSSFYPRSARPGHLMIEPAFGVEVAQALQARGHRLEISDPWAVGRLTAAMRDQSGLLRAAATPRLMQAYAIGR